MAWLRPEFRGPRSPEDAWQDLGTILAADPPLDRVEVRIDRNDGESSWVHGVIAAHEHPDGACDMLVGGTSIVRLRRDDIIAATLHTFDGADYYTLAFELSWGSVAISDGYNK